MEKIAVILPVYKNDKVHYVRLSVNSILTQTYKGEIKLFIGVDGPVDESLALCLHEYEQKENVSVHWFPKNRGLAIVLNDLLAMAHKQKYEYIARMDADDMMMPKRLEIQLNYLLQHPDIDVVGGAITEIDEHGNERGMVIKYPLTHEECVDFFAIRNPLAHPAVMFRYSFFDKLQGGYRADHPKNQDTMLWLDGLKKGCKMANVSDIVLKFRMTDDLFRKRRNGWNLAKRQLADRLEVNRGLHYGIKSYIFAYANFFMQISPAWVKKFCYRMFR